MPDHIREAAREAPDHWIGVVDPAWTDAAPPPPSALAGEWRSGRDGDVVEWHANDDYRPSPLALGWPEPTDTVDAAVQLAVTGYGSLDDAVEALAGAEVMVLRG
ncbi:type VII secretion system-associated protein, partial [Streptomyces sp. JV184]|uniref:type VII secretion system-associated protein n=1 Tax=Streptomyces sp. JV184 TaxID=858637 RepID=UPI003FA720B0